jgi:HTH-type transcriptional regulator, competence development regulator
MTTEFNKEWCLNMARLEGDAEIGAGMLAVDPVFDGDLIGQPETEEEPALAFGRFVRLMRRRRGMDMEKLANTADIDIVELMSIEEDPHFRPEVRTVYQLSMFFDLPRESLLQIAGLTKPKDERIYEEAVRFAARSETVAALTPEERAALEAFVAVLSEKK